jgi:glycosyltransferase involved in cell wall biosynthesis
MKVGVYLDDYVPEDGGGYTFQTEVFLALGKLIDDCHHQFVIISEPNKEIESQVHDRKLQWLPCRRPNFIEKLAAFLVRTWPGLRSRIRWQSPLERISRRAGIEFVWFLSPRLKDLDLPYMTVVLDLQHRLQPWFPEVSAYGEWETRERHYASLLPRAVAIIAGTQAGKDEIIRLYQVPAERIHILPHPTPSYAFAANDGDDKKVLARLGLEPGYLFYPAQFWAHKNHVNLLIALNHLRQQGLKLQLVLVGADFGNRNTVETQIKELGLEDQVHILGFVPQADIPTLYRSALALTYLSFFGPENMPPLEAFALGCAVVAANVSGAEQQMGDAALLVDPIDPKAIASAIRKLADDKELRDSLVTRGRQRAASWTVEDFAHGVFRILDSFEPIRRVWRD